MLLMDQVLSITPCSILNWNSTVAVLSSVVTIYVFGIERCQGASGTVSAVKSLRCHSNLESQCSWAAASRSLKRRGIEDLFGIRRPFYGILVRTNTVERYDHTSTVNQGGRWENCAIGALSGSKKAARKMTSIMPVDLPIFWRASLSRPLMALLPGQPP